MTMPCLKCKGRKVDTQEEGYNQNMPSISCHKCEIGKCRHTWYTCNSKCRIENGEGKRRFNDGGIYTSAKAARRHHVDCHTHIASRSRSGLPLATGCDFDNNANVIDDVINESPHFMDFQDSGETLFECQASMDCQDGAGARHSSPTLIMEDDSHLDFLTAGDGELVADVDDNDLFYNHLEAVADIVDQPTTPEASILTKPVELFKSHMVAGNAALAASVVVTQALFQTSVLSDTPLPVANVMLFLYLAKLVISTGQLQQGNLSKVLQILYPYAEKCESSWAPMPCTVSGFTSRITNVTNSNSLVSILPIPCPETLTDGHGYTPFREVLTHALMMKKFESQDTKDPKWKSLASSKKFKAFLQRIPQSTGGNLSIQQIAVGVIVWTDGWDTSTGTKSNRSPMHTGTVTLVFVNVESGEVVGIATYPNMGGPGKIDHGSVFRRFQEDMASFEKEGSDRVFQSVHFDGDVEMHTQILFVVQDQPERRQASGLLGGGSTLHPLFGTSCDFDLLELPFAACADCENTVHQYLEKRDWSKPSMENGCANCLGWSLPHLATASYKSRCKAPMDMDADTPGDSLFSGPGRLPSRLLIDGWNHCIQMFAIQHKWSEADVKKYLGQLCINEATVTMFVDSCRQFVFLKDIADNPDEYTADEVAEVQQDALDNPSNYDMPKPPAMWFLSDTEEKPEGIMHLSMGIQKAIFKFIIRWAAENKKGAALQRRLADGLCALQELKVSYCPCRPYKDDKFGGFNAESYRAMTMVSTQLYRCLLETSLVPPPPRGDNPKPQNEWTKEDNTNWMYLRDVKHSSKISAPEARAQVKKLLELPPSSQPPVVNTPKEPVTTGEIRQLVFRMQNMFRAIFCTDLCEYEAKNRATASVMRFLSLMESLDWKLNPKREKAIWIAKYNFLGLLRICESFELFRHARNLYEGGVIGEGIVKQLRPLTASGMHWKWATNLLLKYYRQLTLDMLIAASEGSGSRRKHCPLGENVESCKFKRYTHAVDVAHLMATGQPLPVLLYGSESEWMAGVIIVSKNHWYFKEISFGDGTDTVDDEYGLAYHLVELGESNIPLGVINEEFTMCLDGNPALPFWDYGLVLPDILRADMEDREGYRYAMVRSNWQYLDMAHVWNEFE
jgi:hypothetical protein